MSKPLPLAGRRVVNTRAPHQAAAFDALLRAQGAEPVPYPCIDIAPPENTGVLDSAIQAAAQSTFDWLVLTSTNTVLMIAQRIEALGLPAGALGGVRVATVGPSTAKAAEAGLGVTVDLMPDEYVAEALAEALKEAPGKRILLPQSAIARSTLRDELTAAGLDVTAIDAYRTMTGTGGADVPAMLKAGQIDAVTFTSSSTAKNFVKRLGEAGGSVADLGGVVAVCIGPITGKTAAGLGMAATITPPDYTLDGMVEAMVEHFAVGERN